MTGATIRCLSHSANPAIKNRVSDGERCRARTVARAERFTAEPSYKWSWSSESNTRRRGTSSLHCHCARPANLRGRSSEALRSPRNTGGGGENCTPDDLLCRQTPFLSWLRHLKNLERSTGIAPVFPDRRSGVLLLYELRPGERRVSAIARELFAGLRSNASRSPHINGASSES